VTRLLGLFHQLGARQAENRQAVVVGVDRGNHGSCLLGVVDNPVVERTMRFHVVH
jgi:hypothetical protein